MAHVHNTEDSPFLASCVPKISQKYAQAVNLRSAAHFTRQNVYEPGHLRVETCCAHGDKGAYYNNEVRQFLASGVREISEKCVQAANHSSAVHLMH